MFTDNNRMKFQTLSSNCPLDIASKVQDTHFTAAAILFYIKSTVSLLT